MGSNRGFQGPNPYFRFLIGHRAHGGRSGPELFFIQRSRPESRQKLQKIGGIVDGYRRFSWPLEPVMDLLSLAVIAGGLLLYSLISGRLEGTIITAPLVFIGFGFAVGPGGLNVANVDVGHSAIHVVAELTLILVLFTDAARIDLDRVWRDHNLPVRLLIIGLPITIVAGTFIAAMLFPAFSIWEAALLAALLAPTDAALGQSVVSAKAVPVRIRQAINVESGLNDGIVLPAVIILAAFACAENDATQASDWVRFGLLQITLGPLAGVVLGYIGAKFLDGAGERGWATTSFQGIGILSLAILAFVAAELIGGNGFIAAFVGVPSR